MANPQGDWYYLVSRREREAKKGLVEDAFAGGMGARTLKKQNKEGNSAEYGEVGVILELEYGKPNFFGGNVEFEAAPKRSRGWESPVGWKG